MDAREIATRIEKGVCGNQTMFDEAWAELKRLCDSNSPQAKAKMQDVSRILVADHYLKPGAHIDKAHNDKGLRSIWVGNGSKEVSLTPSGSVPITKEGYVNIQAMVMNSDDGVTDRFKIKPITGASDSHTDPNKYKPRSPLIGDETGNKPVPDIVRDLTDRYLPGIPPELLEPSKGADDLLKGLKGWMKTNPGNETLRKAVVASEEAQRNMKAAGITLSGAAVLYILWRFGKAAVAAGAAVTGVGAPAAGAILLSP